MIITNRVLLPASMICLATSCVSLVYAADETASGGEQEQLIEDEIAKNLDGYRAGGFLVRPEAALSAVHDSNVFATRNDEADDWIMVFSPALDVVSDWQQHELKMDLGGAFGRYDKQGDEDYNDYWGNVSGRYDFSKATNVFGGLGYSFEHEDRGSPEDDLSGDEPTTFGSTRAHAGIAHSSGAVGVRAGGTFERLDFDDVRPLSNDDRDRDLLGLGLRVSYELQPKYTLYVQGISDNRDYDSAVDDNGFQRDSDGYRADVGASAQFTNRLKGDAYVGWIDQSYDDSRFSDVSVVDFGGSLSWRAAPRTTWSLVLDRSLEETTLRDSSGYLYTSLYGQVQHLLAPRVTFNAGVSAARADYREIDREDDYYTAQLGMRYYLAPRWYLGAEYRVMSRDSSTREAVANPADRQNLDDYGRNQFFITLGTLLYPVKQGAYWDMPSGQALTATGANWAGFYVGAQAGHESFNARTEGQRDEGSDVAEYSDHDYTSGLFAGYGLTHRHLYLGVELEAETSDAEIYHTKEKTKSRTVSVDLGNTIGAALRLGYRSPTGPLLYGRVGMVETDFDAFYTVNDPLVKPYKNDLDKSAVRYGVGSDIPVTDSLFVRMDYTHSDYDDFVADIETEGEEINPSQNLFRLGLGWQFGAGGKATVQSPVKVAGPYVGAHVGHGTLDSRLTGVHSERDPSAPGGVATSDFVGDFGYDSGFTSGVFLGYGQTWKRWYLGLEGEVEDSSLGWEHIREPNGRNFSVDKKESRGYAVRGGYALASGALVYARVGQARTRFNTSWTKGENRANDVDRDDTVTGYRYGVGAEVPITRSGFVRLDYTYTDYEKYDFVTSHGTPDDMKFENSETLFRLGVGARFQ